MFKIRRRPPFSCRQVANRVAEERGALLGHEVGYTIRFDDCSDPHATRIKVLPHQKAKVLFMTGFLQVLNYVCVFQFLTDGMLVREMMADPLLKKYRYMISMKALYRWFSWTTLPGSQGSVIESQNEQN